MIWYLLGGCLLAAGAIIPAGWAWQRSRMGSAEAQARSCYELLGYSLETIAVGTDEDSVRLLARASERWNTAGATLAGAASAPAYRIAECTAQEGLDLLHECS